MGRLERLQKRLTQELNMTLIAPDAPFSVTGEDEASVHLTWWTRQGNDYQGIESTLDLLKRPPWNSKHVVGVMGFSQGGRLAHLLARLRQEEFRHSNSFTWFPNLKFVIIVAGYDAPLPDGHSHLFMAHTGLIRIPSLHVWGLADSLILPAKSECLTMQYENPKTHVHPGTHFVPTKKQDIQVYIDFIKGSTASHESKVPEMQPQGIPRECSIVPDEETATMQHDEVQALLAMFPDEIRIKSPHHYVGDELVMNFPIVYHLKLLPEGCDNCLTKWPVHTLTLEIMYPHNYPLEVTPQYRLIHANNNSQFSSSHVEKILNILESSSQIELGIPSVLSGIYAVKEFLDAPPIAERAPETEIQLVTELAGTVGPNESSLEDNTSRSANPDLVIRVSSPERIQLCNLEGLEIAERVLKYGSNSGTSFATSFDWNKSGGGGGSFGQYTIGLVGKPSAGKSTFFNAATAFSRQRNSGGEVTAGGNNDNDWGGASMAAHPFTTIDPNIGYCLVPAPFGLCPEDNTETPAQFGSMHGRSPSGQRFLPVLLKDVAGLVPGAYLGRGRGNQFLNDLTDATVLIHVVDASGTADAQGNKVVVGADSSELTNPLDDLAWIRNELVEWVYSNLERKWTTIVRKGRDRLPKMFSGYGQRDMETRNILTALEEFLGHRYQRVRALDHLGDWDQGDIHRLVSAFLGVRFPMALALNKCDLPSSQGYVRLIQESLPIHGAHVCTPMAAENEMQFVRNHLRNEESKCLNKLLAESFHGHVWDCLTSALRLREPVLVFPVSDMTTYSPLPGLHKRAISCASLPSPGMIRCMKASGGILPSFWDENQQVYVIPSKDKSSRVQLRDVLIMKSGSTVEDVFLSLKKVGAISGEFVRAEAAGEIGEKGKPIPKSTLIGKRNRIIRIMSNKRTAWQN